MYPVINPGCKHGPSDNKYISCEHVHVCVHHVLTDCVTINTCTIKEKQQHYMHRRHFYNVFSGRSRAIFHTVNSVQQLHLSLCICISQTWQLSQEKKAVKKKSQRRKCGTAVKRLILMLFRTGPDGKLLCRVHFSCVEVKFKSKKQIL